MGKRYTEKQLREIGMDDAQIRAILHTYEEEDKKEIKAGEVESAGGIMGSTLPTQNHNNVVNISNAYNSMRPTPLSEIEKYKVGMVVELPPFAEGQPFVARLTRPSMLALVKTGKIPNSLLNQATSLFANGAGALNTGGKNATNVSELFDVIDVIVDAALMEPTLKEIRSVGMELSDDQLMAIFSYTQNGVKALEQFRTVRADSQRNSDVKIV